MNQYVFNAWQYLLNIYVKCGGGDIMKLASPWFWRWRRCQKSDIEQNVRPGGKSRGAHRIWNFWLLALAVSFKFLADVLQAMKSERKRGLYPGLCLYHEACLRSLWVLLGTQCCVWGMSGRERRKKERIRASGFVNACICVCKMEK